MSTLYDIYLRHICSSHYVMGHVADVMGHVAGKQLKMLYHETVLQNQIKLVATEKTLNSQKCLITLHIVGWVIIYKYYIPERVIVRMFTLRK